jgi:YebC/PmpR family DNA-binding regulatory protein
MAGHSHWKQIQYKKGAADIKRGQIFSKLLSAISIAARENPNPDFNPRLRSAVEKAKENQVPLENIERAIKKASESKNLEEVVIEAYGPEKVAMIIEGITDNKNRTINELRTLLSGNGAKMAEQGSVLWSFEKKNNEWQPKFKQPVSEEGKKNLDALIEKLEEHGDIQRIVTNAS